jgi:hypothetical protein
MSVRVNHYVLLGVLFPMPALKIEYADLHERLEPFMDSPLTDLIVHIDGLCCLYDGMNGDYVAIGKVLAKTEDGGGFQEPVALPMAPSMEWHQLRTKIVNLLPRTHVPLPGWLVISHYR